MKISSDYDFARAIKMKMKIEKHSSSEYKLVQYLTNDSRICIKWDGPSDAAIGLLFVE